MSFTAPDTEATLPGGPRRPEVQDAARAGYGPTLALVVTLALAAFLIVMAVVLLIVHPAPIPGLPAVDTLFEQQDTHAKTDLYLAAFLVVLPLAVALVPRLADRVARGPNRDGLARLALALAIALAVVLILVRLSAHAPWGDGLSVVLVGVGAWWVAAGVALARAAAQRPWAPLLAAPRARSSATATVVVAGVLVLCLTDLHGLSMVGLLVGAALALAGLAAHRHKRTPPRRLGLALDLLAVVLLALAIPDVVVFTSSGAIPNSYFPPGIIQFHQDFLLGPANQLLGGGALLVGVPVSQYGVGFIYGLAAWFGIAPIGYGTYGLLDGIMTAAFYVLGYALLRIAGVGRLLAAAALAFAVAVFIDHLYYTVGALPQQGPLRFGLPMLVVVAATARARWPQRAASTWALEYLTLGIAAVWSLEACVYTLFTALVLASVEVLLQDGARRPRRLAVRVGAAIAAILVAHLLLIVLTLIGTGQLPDYNQYLAYVRALVFGSVNAGQISYGFANWSPAVAVAVGWAASVAALALMTWRATAFARAQGLAVTALAGLTAYGIALFSYTDNRSSTYLLLYIALPQLLAAVLWWSLIARTRISGPVRRAALAVGLAVAVVMLAAAWPTISANFSRSALAHASGLGGALHRLEHPPPIDPRAPVGEALLDRYAPGRRALVLLPEWPDLGTEILMRSHRFNLLFIGDPKADGFIDPSEWTGRIATELGRVRAGRRLLTDATGLRVVRELRGRPADAAVTPGLGPLNPQLDWILHQLDLRFVIKPIDRDRSGLIVAQLVAR